MAANIQLTIHTDNVNQSSASGTITDPKVLEAALVVMDYLTNAAAGLPAEPTEPPATEPTE